MAVFNDWKRSLNIMHLIILNLVACLAWLSGIASAQLEFSEAATGSVTFPAAAIACIGNLGVFFTCLLRGRLDLENGARDILATHRGPKLKKIKGSGLTTCDIDEEGKISYEEAAVVMLSLEPFHSSVTQFMRYIHHAHHVHSILLKFLPLTTAEKRKFVPAQQHDNDVCACIVLWAEEEEIREMIASRIPGTLNCLTGSLYLLPCWRCWGKCCIVSNKSLLHVQQTDLQLSCREADSMAASPQLDAEAEPGRSFSEPKSDVGKSEAKQRLKLRELPEADFVGEIHVNMEGTEGRSMTEEAESLAAVCQFLDYKRDPVRDGSGRRRCCFCIPLLEADSDEWIKLLIRFLKSKDNVAREVRIAVADAMGKYIDRSGESSCVTTDLLRYRYDDFGLLVQRLIEASVNIALTGWLRVDGFSSSLISRGLVRDYHVDSKGTSFAANGFLIRADVKCNQKTVCQALLFRGNFVGVRTSSYFVGSVNLICPICWGVLISSEGSVAGKWYGKLDMSPSKPRVFLILVGIGGAVAMDFLNLLCLYALQKVQVEERRKNQIKRKILLVYGVVGLEIVYIVSGSVAVKGLDNIGKWVYSTFQGLIWVKWGVGSYLLGDYDNTVEDLAKILRKQRFPVDRVETKISRVSREILHRLYYNGVLVYSSAFMLNAVLAVVLGKWWY